jgi:hypothetical protein
MKRQRFKGEPLQQKVHNRPRPENKDDLDSRERKDTGYKDGNNKQGRKPNTKDR